MKKLILTIAFFLFFCVFASKSAFASLTISLSGLPSFVNRTNIKLYYTYLNTNGSSATVNLYVQKDGKDYRQTQDKDKTTVSGFFQIAGSDIYDGEGKYNFYATVSSDSNSVTSATVSTTLDMSPPSTPTDLAIERLSLNSYKLTWKSSFDDDFEKVLIYRSEKTAFNADSGTKIGEAGGAKNEIMTFIDGSPLPNSSYFYAIRAVDHAGNISGIATNAPNTIVTVTGSVKGQNITSVPKSGNVLSLSEEKITPTVTEKQGEINGGVSKEGVSDGGKVDGFVSKNKKGLIAAAGGAVLVLAYIVYRRKK